MINFQSIENIYICSEYTDLRKGIDGYARIIQDTWKKDPFDKALYIFCNQQRNKIKCLYWDGTGFWLLYKRLDNGHFKWKVDKEKESVKISQQQLDWLLSGLKIDSKTSIKERHPKYV